MAPPPLRQLPPSPRPHRPPQLKEAPAPAAPVPAPAASREKDDDESDVRSSPLVRKLAREHNIDLAQVTGTGTGGRVTKQDVLDFLAHRGSAPVAAPSTSAPGAPSKPGVGLGGPAAPRRPLPFPVISFP